MSENNNQVDERKELSDKLSPLIKAAEIVVENLRFAKLACISDLEDAIAAAKR